ncbi:MAG: hypothetical protein WC552_10000 [Candidatus Omnitrophota bacterium]
MGEYLRKLLLIVAVMLTFFAAFVSMFGENAGKSAAIAVGDIKAGTVEIEGPGAVSDFLSEDYWLPGKAIEKTALIKNVGELPVDLTASASGSVTRGSDAIVNVEFIYDGDISRDYHNGGIHLAPGETQKIRIKMEFSPIMGNAYQESSWNVVLTFFAKQCDYYEK